MSDQVIGRCSKCGRSLTSGHNCEPKNPFKGLNLVAMRFDQIEKRLDALEERQLAEVKVAMKPEPTGLIELVGKLGEICSVDDFPCTKQFAGTLGLVLNAAARERRIAEKRDYLITVIRRHANKANDINNALKAYDEECAK